MPVLVTHIDNMDRETFQKHMEHRHRESLGGLTKLRLANELLEEYYRVFHRTLHRLRLGIQHEHAE